MKLNRLLTKSIAFLFAIFFFLVLAQPAQGQVYDNVTLYQTTVANSATVTAYVQPLHKYNDAYKYFEQTDSIEIQLNSTGEIDLDQLIVTKGFYIGGTFYAVATPDTTTLTIDNAVGVITVVISKPVTNGCTDLEYYNAVKVVVNAAAAGNDATDPNKLELIAKRFITRKNPYGLY